MKKKSFLAALAIISMISQVDAQTSVSNSTEVALPLRYFQLLEAGIDRVKTRFAAEQPLTLASLESQPGWAHFPNAILMPAVLYTKSHPLNKRFGDTSLLS